MLRAFLVDDEELARDRLKCLLAEVGGVAVVGEASDGEEALRAIPRVNPDLLFLDIQMPGRTGMEVASALPPPRPRIIFCTAFDHYAIQAFEQHAVDYLLKPLSRERLHAAVGKVRDTVESEERILRELTSASEAQALLYPSGGPGLATLEVSGACRSAREVGGDYYDFLPLGDGRMALAVGDVSGKGLFAGLLMAGLQGRVQSLARRYGEDLEALFIELNRVLHAVTGSNRYVTLFYAVYDEAARRLTYVNAGHPAPILLRRGGAAPGGVALSETLPTSPTSRSRVTSHDVLEAPPTSSAMAPEPRIAGTTFVDANSSVVLEATGTVVGLLPEVTYKQASVGMSAGDLLLIFSDGLIETRTPSGEEWGTAGVKAAAVGSPERSAEALRDHILKAAERFRGGAPVEDDVTLVVARVR